ncbi:MAG: hypothetical protein ABEJ56_01695 [Candidatus Nanohaloarchaea archaeon]
MGENPLKFLRDMEIEDSDPYEQITSELEKRAIGFFEREWEVEEDAAMGPYHGYSLDLEDGRKIEIILESGTEDAPTYRLRD